MKSRRRREPGGNLENWVRVARGFGIFLTAAGDAAPPGGGAVREARRFREFSTAHPPPSDKRRSSFSISTTAARRLAFSASCSWTTRSECHAVVWWRAKRRPISGYERPQWRRIRYIATWRGVVTRALRLDERRSRTRRLNWRATVLSASSGGIRSGFSAALAIR